MKTQLGYDFIKEAMKRNKALKNLSNDDIDIIIFNQMRKLAESRKWTKHIPASVFQHL
jgi:hypothetical protein